MSDKKVEIRKIAEENIWAFARLVNPQYMYGDLHRECLMWLADSKSESQLLLLPRGHMKSHMIAVWCAWYVTRNPETTILYTSATDDLANSQLYAIQLILDSPIYRKYWPEMIHEQPNMREKWSATEIIVDHPKRKEFGVRDATVAARSVGSNTTGLHCDVLVFDDVVVPKNAYTDDGRQKVAAAYSQFSSVKNPGSIVKAVGTRYHPRDIYSAMIEMELEDVDDEGNVIGANKVYDVIQRSVIEDEQFIWPREQHPRSKKWYGFDRKVLAKIKVDYTSVGENAQFFAQYYNDPNDPTSERIATSKFQYYDRSHLTYENQVYRINGKSIAVYAAADLAYTTGDKSDFTAIVVIGIDKDGLIYVLDLVQFRTDKYEKIYQEMMSLWEKWRFKKIRIETQAGANLVATYVKDQSRREGKSFMIDATPSPPDKKKHERIAAILEPRYENNTVWHTRGGYTAILEDQLVLARPDHDDLKDALAMAVEIARPDMMDRGESSTLKVVMLNSRFGGFARG